MNSGTPDFAAALLKPPIKKRVAFSILKPARTIDKRTFVLGDCFFVQLRFSRLRSAKTTVLAWNLWRLGRLGWPAASAVWALRGGRWWRRWAPSERPLLTSHPRPPQGVAKSSQWKNGFDRGHLSRRHSKTDVFRRLVGEFRAYPGRPSRS